MSLRELSQAGRAPVLPLQLELADAAGSAPLHVERLLRVLPGQRYVGLAQWRGRPVLAKLLVGERAARHFRRERDGARLLAEQGLVTPLLLAEGLVEGEGGWLLFDYLDGAESLWDAWRVVANEPLLSDGQQAVLAEALVAIAQMHAKGLWQADLHLDNLLMILNLPDLDNGLWHLLHHHYLYPDNHLIILNPKHQDTYLNNRLFHRHLYLKDNPFYQQQQPLVYLGTCLFYLIFHHHLYLYYHLN